MVKQKVGEGPVSVGSYSRLSGRLVEPGGLGLFYFISYLLKHYMVFGETAMWASFAGMP